MKLKLFNYLRLKLPLFDGARKVLFLERFRRFAEEGYRDGVFGDSRYRHYGALLDKMERFLAVSRKENLLLADCDGDFLMELRNFLYDEYLYPARCPDLYRDVRVPSARRATSTVVCEMKMLSAFFSELGDRDEIPKSPFRKLGAERRRTVMHAVYDDPYFLRPDELQRIREVSLPPVLEPVRDAFLLHCMLGCRVGDYGRLTLDNVAESADGIPYVHYLPRKTSRDGRREVQTPLLPSALSIIRRRGFAFPFVRYPGGEYGYNRRIRDLLAAAGIDRTVPVYDPASGGNVYRPLCEIASSKLCRRTFVDRMAKVQVDLYASGLHREGSSAVRHYTEMELRDRYRLLCAAFGEQPL